MVGQPMSLRYQGACIAKSCSFVLARVTTPLHMTDYFLVVDAPTLRLDASRAKRRVNCMPTLHHVHIPVDENLQTCCCIDSSLGQRRMKYRIELSALPSVT